MGSSRFLLAILMAGLALSLIFGNPGTARSENQIRLSEEQNGSRIELQRGDTLEIALAGNPTTGYLWTIQPFDPGMIIQEGAPRYRSDRPIPGSGGTFLFRFKALGTGSIDLRLIYHRTFEKETPPIRTFSVNVVVKNGNCP